MEPVEITPAEAAALLDAQRQMGLDVVERNVSRTEIYEAKEAFLCGTSIEIAPILSVDHIQLGHQPGEITKQLRDQYFTIARGETDQYSHWRTPIYP